MPPWFSARNGGSRVGTQTVVITIGWCSLSLAREAFPNGKWWPSATAKIAVRKTEPHFH